MIVVVGGQTRNAGKTTAACDIIRATPQVRWIAVKISRHAHGGDLSAPIVREEREPSSDTDSGRYLEAGAGRSFWIRASHAHTPAVLAALPQGDWLIESNSVLDFLTPDLFVFVEDAQSNDWKDSARRVAGRAGVRIQRETAPAVEAVLKLLRAGPTRI